MMVSSMGVVPHAMLNKYLLCCRYWDTRPTAVITRIVQLMMIAGSFISGLVSDLAQGERTASSRDRPADQVLQLRCHVIPGVNIKYQTLPSSCHVHAQLCLNVFHMRSSVDCYRRVLSKLVFLGAVSIRGAQLALWYLSPRLWSTKPQELLCPSTNEAMSHAQQMAADCAIAGSVFVVQASCSWW